MAVYKETNKNKIPKDGRSWCFRCYYTDMYGNRKQKQSKFYFTKKEAEQSERDFLKIVETTDIVDVNISFESVFNEWLIQKRQLVKCTTYYGVKKRVNKYILSFFKPYKLHSIKTKAINEWLEKMNNSNVSLEYVNKIIGYLKEILIYAKEHYDFDNKVVAKIHQYKLDVKTKKRDSEWNYWTYEEFNNFISNVDDEFYFKIFNFLYYTGLREGEMIGLQWKNVNLERKTINIETTFTNKVEDKVYDLIDPKTKNSIRIIDMDDELADILKSHYEKEKKLYNFNSDMFVFGNVKYVSPTTLARKLNKYIAKTQETTEDFKKITPHGFRHSHVSLLINLGADSRDVAARIGDTVRMVEETYYHMFPNKKSNTINIINTFKKEK